MSLLLWGWLATLGNEQPFMDRLLQDLKAEKLEQYSQALARFRDQYPEDEQTYREYWKPLNDALSAELGDNTPELIRLLGNLCQHRCQDEAAQWLAALLERQKQFEAVMEPLLLINREPYDYTFHELAQRQREYADFRQHPFYQESIIILRAIKDDMDQLESLLEKEERHRSDPQWSFEDLLNLCRSFEFHFPYGRERQRQLVENYQEKVRRKEGLAQVYDVERLPLPNDSAGPLLLLQVSGMDGQPQEISLASTQLPTPPLSLIISTETPSLTIDLMMLSRGKRRSLLRRPVTLSPDHQSMRVRLKNDVYEVRFSVIRLR